MTPLAHLWLPILASTVATFFLSAVSHMALPWRKKEWGRMGAKQDAVQAALSAVGPGQYGFPAPEGPMAPMSKEWLARWEAGPSGWLTIEAPGPMAMGRKLAASFVAYAAVTLLVGYVAALALGPTTPGLVVVRVVSTLGVVAYGAGPVFASIWYARPWRVYLMDLFDAVLYGFAMAGIFAALWPR
jgi:hypothetical protein